MTKSDDPTSFEVHATVTLVIGRVTKEYTGDREGSKFVHHGVMVAEVFG